MRYATALILLLAVGCGTKSADKVAPSTTVTEGASSMPAGWKHIKVENIHMALPNEWQVADLTQGDLEKMMSGLTFGPGAENLKGQIQQMAATGMFKLFAFGPKSTKGFQENLNVNATLVNEKTLEEGKASVLAQMKTVAPDATAELMKDVQAVVVSATMEAQGAKGSFKYATRGYMFLKGGKGYTFTFSCSVDDKKTMAEFADKVAKTISID